MRWKTPLYLKLSTEITKLSRELNCKCLVDNLLWHAFCLNGNKCKRDWIKENRTSEIIQTRLLEHLKLRRASIKLQLHLISELFSRHKSQQVVCELTDSFQHVVLLSGELILVDQLGHQLLIQWLHQGSVPSNYVSKLKRKEKFILY